jgi:hypothetical protein
VILPAWLAMNRRRYNRRLRILLGVLALFATAGVAAVLFLDLGLTRAAVGLLSFAGIYAVLVWAVCFSFATQDNPRFTKNAPCRTGGCNSSPRKTPS